MGVIKQQFMVKHLLLIILLNVHFRDTLERKTICTSQKCVDTGHKLNEMINSNVHPCTDFYEFVCGNFMNEQKIPLDDYMVNSSSEIINTQLKKLRELIENLRIENEEKPFQLVQRFYSSCLNLEYRNYDEINNIYTFINFMGCWPVLNDDFDKDDLDIVKLLSIFYKKGLSANYLFKLSMEVDPSKLDSYILTVDQPDLEFRKEIFREGFFSNRKIREYSDYMIDIAVYFGANPKQAAYHFNKTLEFEWKLLNYSLSKEEQLTKNTSNGIIYVRELEAHAPFVNWFILINSFLNEDVFIDWDEQIIVKRLEYLVNLNQLIYETPNVILANYLIWKAIAEISPFLTGELRERYLRYNAAVTGQVQRKPLWRECVETTIKYFPAVVSLLYAKLLQYKSFESSTFDVLNPMKYSLEENFVNLNLIEIGDKLRAIEKFQAISYNIGYSKITNESTLTEYYRDLIIFSESYYSSMLNILANNRESFLKQLKQPVSHTKDWISAIQIPFYGALFDHMKNRINLPVGIFNELNAENTLPYYTKFSGIGVVIGREMSHTYDRTGRKFDQFGEMHNWCHHNCDNHFLKRDRCVIDQYNYFMANKSTKAVGNITQDKNIADIEGVKLAYDAYNRWLNNRTEEPQLPPLKYDNRQMFWIWYGLTHCTKYRPNAYRSLIVNGDDSDPKYRVNNPLRNSQHFAKDFNCNISDYMWLDNSAKCTVG